MSNNAMINDNKSSQNSFLQPKDQQLSTATGSIDSSATKEHGHSVNAAKGFKGKDAFLADLKGKLHVGNGVIAAVEALSSECSFAAVVKAGEDAVCKQVAELLQRRDLSLDELGLLYCYKFGFNVAHVLNAVGSELDSLRALVKARAIEFTLGEDLKVTLNGRSPKSPSLKLKPFSAKEELLKIFGELCSSSPSGSVDLKDLGSSFSGKFGQTVSSVVGMRISEFIRDEMSDSLALVGDGTVTLKGRVDKQLKQSARASDAKKAASSDAAKQSVLKPVQATGRVTGEKSFAAAVAGGSSANRKVSASGNLAAAQAPSALAPPPGLDIGGNNQKHAPTGEEICSTTGSLMDQTGAAAAAAKGRQPATSSLRAKSFTNQLKRGYEVNETSEQQFLDLHNRVCSKQFLNRAAAALSLVTESLKENLGWLDAEAFVKGGAAARGTVVQSGESTLPDGEVVIFLNGLAEEKHAEWMPGLLRTIQAVLQTNGNLANVDASDIVLDEDNWVVAFTVIDAIRIKIRVSPEFGGFEEIIQAEGRHGPECRKMFSKASLARERNQFIGRQPGNVKTTMRLLKWWRDQQVWSHRYTTPSDDLLETIVAMVWASTKPTSQQQAIANTMSTLASFDELNVSSSLAGLFRPSDVWSPLLQQKPLLVDPVNPFVNLCDPLDFDGRELQRLAQKTHFFW